MRVRRLELFGFKSFAVKTGVQFEPGVTAIVGPNGSGKSNLVDGIRWVLGEHNPRDVRAPRLEDIIFNGTDTKAPLSMAEVSLTIDNEQGLLPIAFSEIQVTRRVYRSGESECFINQSPCRLKDVQELFLGTGLGGGAYAIIEQGHIDLILSSKPEERRAVFEEASGIARYLTKKQETLRRLDDVEQDLVRVADITQEVRRQVSALERQASKARQYKTQWDQLKSWELRLAADELRQGSDAQEELTKRVDALKQQHAEREAERQRLLESLEACNAAVGTVQAQLQDVRTRIVESTSHIEQHTSQLSLKTRWVDELTQQQRQRELDEAQLQGRAQELTQQLERLTQQHTTLQQDHQTLTVQRASIEQELQRLEGTLTDALKALEGGKTDLFGAATAASQQRNVLTDIVLRLQTVGAQAGRADDQRRTLQQRLESLAERQRQLEQERRVLSEQHETLQRQLSAASQATAQAQQQRHELMGRASSQRERLLSQQATVQLLEEVWRRYEGFPESIKTLLANPPEGVLGLLAEALNPQPGFERALEAALGSLATAIVVRDRRALERCREFLAVHQCDGAQVVVLSDFEGASIPTLPSSTQGFIGWLPQYVRHDAIYRGLVQRVLGSWGVVEDITRLLQASTRGTWVSKAGDRWDGLSWQFAGTGSGTHARVGRKQRWEQARQELEALARETTALQESVQQAEARWQSLVEEEAQVRRQVEGLAPSLTKLEGQLTQLAHETSRAQEELDAHQEDHAEWLRQQQELSASHEKAQQAVAEAEARQQQVEQALKDAQARREEATQRKQQQLIAAAQLDASLKASGDRREELRVRIEDVQSQHRQVNAQLEQKRQQTGELSAKIEALSTQLNEHRAQIPALTESQTTLQAQADEITSRLQEVEAKRNQVMPNLLGLEQELMKLAQSLKEQEQQLSERSFRRSRILERLREVYHIEEDQVLAEQTSLSPIRDEERQSLAAQIEKLKARLESMGPVSLGSVEEYDELTKRLQFLQTQQADLLKAREDLRHSIQQINRTARSQFRETFAKIQQEFQHYFLRLFGGGHADLILMDEEDVLESGIEIVARPPGKRPQSISLLSGGERALTAIALLFALFKVRPSPFCILDEIDAPLDEANVDRFTKVLEEFLSLSQFILITHNKKTITKADCMYGVTMEQPGMSKIVSVKLTKRKATSPAPTESTPVAA